MSDLAQILQQIEHTHFALPGVCVFFLNFPLISSDKDVEGPPDDCWLRGDSLLKASSATWWVNGLAWKCGGPLTGASNAIVGVEFPGTE
jgi:hypothetical protein